MSKGFGILSGLLIASLTGMLGRAEAACCQASCIGPVPWVACFADTTSCNTLVCAGGGSTSLHVDALATCGAGEFASCPPTEVGRCSDAINNDGWVDAVTDLADPDCGIGPGAGAVPSLSPTALAGVVLILAAIGGLRLRLSRRD